MKKLLFLILLLGLLVAPPAGAWQVAGQRVLAGFGHPESVAWDPGSKSLYVSRFGPELKPLQKDGKGFISKLDPNGKIIEERFLPAPGQVLHKPKGIWIAGGRLWVTDIDVVWCYDLASKKGRKVELPGAVFANDPVVAGGQLYVSDMTGGVIYLARPADCLAAPPQVSQLVSGASLFPNGLAWHPSHGLVIARSPRDGSPSSIAKLDKTGRTATLVPFPKGRLDGLAVLPDGSLLFTDWASHALYQAGPSGPAKKLAHGFSGPADFGLIPQKDGFTIVLPDLVSGNLHFIELKK